MEWEFPHSCNMAPDQTQAEHTPVYFECNTDQCFMNITYYINIR